MQSTLDMIERLGELLNSPLRAKRPYLHDDPAEERAGEIARLERSIEAALEDERDAERRGIDLDADAPCPTLGDGPGGAVW